MGIRRLIDRAMRQADDWVVVFDYVDARGVATRRVASPIRFLGADRFLALCLCREEPRQFHMDKCRNLRLDSAANYVMPVAMATTA